MIGEKKMTFRIKNTYQFRCKQNYDGNFVWGEIPELIFSKSDDNAFQNTLEINKNPLFLKVDRMFFNKILNVDNQNLFFFQHKEDDNTWHRIKSKFIYINQFTSDDFDKLFKDLSTIKLEFRFIADKTKLTGHLSIENKNNYSIKISLKKKMAFILGLLHISNLDEIKNDYIDLIIPGNVNDTQENVVNTKFDIMRPFKGIKLYSKFLFDYPTELCFKSFSKNEISINDDKDLNYDFELKDVSLPCKVFKVDRFSPFNCKFYFLDFFNDYVYFDFVHLTVFISNKQ